MADSSARCLFCSIVARDVPSTAVYEDEHNYAFEDLHPQAPTHFLVVPKRHFADLVELAGDPDSGVALLRGIRAATEQRGLTDFRTVFNTGAGAQQTVFHVHAHVLAGRPMNWPPG